MNYKYNQKLPIKVELYKGAKKAGCKITFSLPIELAQTLESKQLSKNEKINLVKSWTSEVKDENGKLLPRIPNQEGVILIMALEVGAL